MKYEDFKKVEELSKQLKSVEKAYKEAVNVSQTLADNEYSEYLSSWSNGSGWSVDMRGCGVGKEMV